MRISVICPVLNEVDFIGHSIMAALPFVHDFWYMLDDNSDDGTRDLLFHIKDKYAHEKLNIWKTPNFHPSDMKAYNEAFNIGIRHMTGDAAWFLHPDMIVTEGAALKEGPLAWWTQVTSYAGDFQTKITKGRCSQWKNIHAKKFGLHYFGGYGSTNEDFYHSDITGTAYKHYGTDFEKYPFEVAPSGIKVNHYCELKGYKRRLEKMKLCLKTQFPHFDDKRIEEMAIHHPRVTLENSSREFGAFEFSPVQDPTPEVITKYKAEFDAFIPKGELVHG